MWDATVDFFVSYTSADRPCAERIAWELEHAKLMHDARCTMHEAASVARRTVAVLSPSFLERRRLGRVGGGV